VDHGTTSTTDIRLAELMAALSLATDLDMGQPLEWALCSRVAAARLGDILGFSAEELREIYYQALLRYIVCNSETHMLAALAGDEIALRTDFATIDSGSLPPVLGMMTRHIRQANVGASRLELAQVIVRNLLLSARDTPGVFSGHCEGTFWSGMISLAFGIDESEFGAEARLLAPPS